MLSYIRSWMRSLVRPTTRTKYAGNVSQFAARKPQAISMLETQTASCSTPSLTIGYGTGLIRNPIQTLSKVNSDPIATVDSLGIVISVTIQKSRSVNLKSKEESTSQVPGRKG